MTYWIKIFQLSFNVSVKEDINFNCTKWLADSRADIVIRFNFNQVRKYRLDYITYWLFEFNIGNSLHG